MKVLLVKARKYFEIFKLRFKSIYHYKFEFLMTLLRPILELVLIVFVWSVIVNHINITNKKLFFSYLILANAFNVSAVSWIGLANLIRGWHRYDLSVILTKPISIFFNFLARDLSYFVIRSLSLIIALIYFISTSMIKPINILFLIPFIVIGYFLYFLIIYFIDILAFWFTAVWGLRYAYFILARLLSGSLLPLFLFPRLFQKISLYLPFQFFAHVQAYILLGEINLISQLKLLLIGVLWLIFLSIAIKLLFKKGLKKYEAFGG